MYEYIDDYFNSLSLYLSLRFPLVLHSDLNVLLNGILIPDRAPRYYKRSHGIMTKSAGLQHHNMILNSSHTMTFPFRLIPLGKV